MPGGSRVVASSPGPVTVACVLSLAFLIAFGAVFATSGGRALADSGCADGRVCYWQQTYYTGIKTALDEDWAGRWISTGYEKSIKNRFGGRKVQYQLLNGNRQCINPGGERPHPGTFNFVRIGDSGSRC
jgi:hypothetical protein